MHRVILKNKMLCLNVSPHLLNDHQDLRRDVHRRCHRCDDDVTLVAQPIELPVKQDETDETALVPKDVVAQRPLRGTSTSYSQSCSDFGDSESNGHFSRSPEDD